MTDTAKLRELPTPITANGNDLDEISIERWRDALNKKQREEGHIFRPVLMCYAIRL